MKRVAFRGIPMRAQSWKGDGKPAAPPPPSAPLPAFSGRHTDGTAHRLSGCPCGHEGRLESAQYVTIMGDEWSDADCDDDS
jgi:hypothetical protein